MKYFSHLIVQLILLLLLCFLKVDGFTQALPTKDGKVLYESIDSISGSKNDLYNKAKLWFVETFKDSKSVIEIDDKDEGQIAGKGHLDVPYKYGVNTIAQCNFTIKVDLKTDKYRIQVYNINYQWQISGATTITIEQLQTVYNGSYYEKIAPATDLKIKSMIEDFKRAVTSNTQPF